MHTRCPRCQTRYPITAAQLRAGRGDARCERCEIVFDALATLEQMPNETVPPVLSVRTDQSVRVPELSDVDRQDDAGTDPLFSLTADTRAVSRKNQATPRKRKESRSTRTAAATRAGMPWSSLTLVFLVLLWIQYLLFEGERLARDTDIRPWLERACAVFGCTLAPYRDLRLIQAGQASLQKTGPSQGAYEFRMAISNQSPYPQPFPGLQLILGEIDGRTVAERVFEPAEYLSGQTREPLMMTGKTYEIRLLLSLSRRTIGSYRFQMI